jgi:hypothetical protein
VPLQFQLSVGSGLYDLTYGASVALLVGVASYYLLGPFTVPREATAAPTVP